MKRGCLVWAGILGLVSVVVGAATGHDQGDFSHRYQVATRTLQLYAAVLLALAAFPWRSLLINWAIYALGSGASLFSAALVISTWSWFSWVVYFAPLGGLILMIGWALLIAAAFPEVLVQLVDRLSSLRLPQWLQRVLEDLADFIRRLRSRD